MGRNPRVPVDVVARTDKFTRSVNTAAKAATASMAAFATSAAGAVAGITIATVKLSEELNQLAKDARKVGASVEDIQRVGGALELLTGAGVDAARFIQDFQRNLEEVRDGSGPAKDALEKLGISLSDIERLPLSEQLAAIGDGIGNLDRQTAKTQVSLDLFGRNGRAAAEAFGQGGAAFREAVGQIEDVGLVTAEAAFHAEALQDAILIATKRLDLMRTDALAPLMPVITGTVNAISDLGAELRDTGALKRFGDTAARTFIEIVLPAVTTASAESIKAVRGLAATVAALDVGFVAVRMSAAGYASAVDLVANGGKLSAERLAKNAAITEDMEAAQRRLDAATIDYIETDEKAAAVMDRVIEGIYEAQAATDDLADSRRKAGGGSGGGGGSESADPEGENRADERAEHLARIAEEERAAAEEIFDIRHGLHTEILRQNEEERAAAAETAMARAAAAATAFSAVSSTLLAIDNLATAVTDARIAGMDEESDAYEAAMREQWAIQSALAIANAAIAIPLAISQQLAGTPGPAGIALSVVAGVIATANLAAAIAKAAMGPTFHMGGDVLGAPARSISAGPGPDEVNATLLRGERVQSRAEVRQGGARSVTTVFQVGPRVVDAMTTEALRTGQGATFDAFRAVRPVRIGGHNPHRAS